MHGTDLRSKVTAEITDEEKHAKEGSIGPGVHDLWQTKPIENRFIL